jgi:hypothetical protein
MRHLFIFLLILSCSSEKKSRGIYTRSTDNEERITFDWNGDGLLETVQISPVGSARKFRELDIFLGVLPGVPKEKFLWNKNLIPAKSKPGATLRLTKDHSFLLIVDSSGSGRTGEVITRKISWKKGRFVLTGYIRDWSDKLDPSDHRHCELDLRNGRGTLNGKHVKFEPYTVDLLELNDKFIPPICEF